jgi:hypothetical protein
MLDAIRFPESLGDHEIVGRIGRGGVGYVLEVRNRTTGVSYAAKLIVKANDAVARERFRREAELLARCDRHPCVVKVHSFGETADGVLYMIMDLVRGEGLDRLLEREDRLEPRRAAAVGRDVAAALGHAHALGIVHRDVKPSNVLLDEGGGVRLTDFGLATACDLERLTRTGIFLGTVRYCAPEQAAGSTVGPPADVFATGCLLFHALSGRAPLEHLSTPASVFAALSAPAALPDVRTLEPSCPEALARIVACALEKDPDLRYANGGELADDLARFVAGEATSGTLPARRRRRGRRAAGAALALVLLAAGVAALGVVERKLRGRAALAASGVDLETARSILARCDRLSGVPTQSELDLALATSRRGRERALEAASLGAGADEPRRLADASVGQALAALARRHLALGDAAAALALLDAIPGAPGSIAPEERLDRARALSLLGRLDASEAGALGALPLGARHAEALELLGDALRAKGHFANAAAAYAAALDVEATRPRELRVKHGGAAALAGDDRVALAELAALVPEPQALSPGRAANAALADFAPALYRRALAASRETCERDLDLAWRLAPPPTALATPVAARWVALAAPRAVVWNGTTYFSPDEEGILKLRGPLDLFTRARELDPGCDCSGLWESYELLWAWVRRATWGPGPRTRIARSLLAVAPRDPFLLFHLAWCLRPQGTDGPPAATPEQVLARRLEGLDLVREAIDHFPPQRPDEHGMVDTTAWELAALYVALAGERRLELDPERLRRVTDRGEAKDSRYWFFAARYFRLIGEPEKGLEALDRQPPLTAVLGFGPIAGSTDRASRPRVFTEERILCLFLVGRAEESIQVLQGVSPGDRDRSTEVLLLGCRGQELALRAAPVTPADAGKILALGQVYALLGRVAAAEDALARLERLGAAAEVAKLAPFVERARK